DYKIAGLVPARPINDVIHRCGFWALVFLLISLSITPLRRIARLNQLLDVRRMIGVGAFCYIAAHLILYMADQMFDLQKVISEIALRLYLTIGFVALLGLGALAAAAPGDLPDRRPGVDPLLPADQGRCFGAHLCRRPVRLADRLPALGEAAQHPRRAADLDALGA